MKIKIDERRCSVTIGHFYDEVAKVLGLQLSEDGSYDPSKINVASNIQDLIYDYYESQGASVIEIGMAWLNWGPKVDNSLEPFEVEVFEGFVS